MKKDSIRFGRTILIVAILLVIGDIAVGITADKMAENMPAQSGQIAKDNYRLHNMNDEIVIIGSSRGHHHYVTSVLSDSLDLFYGEHHSIYNAAIAGKYANSNACAAEVILSRYHPMLVIYDLPEDQLCDDSYGDIKFSTPFYWKDTIVRRYLDNISTKEKILMKSSLYRYNSKLLRIVSSYLRPEPLDGGYLALYGSSIDTTELVSTTEKKDLKEKALNEYSKTNFERVMERYKAANVPLIVVCSPRFRYAGNNNRLKSLCDIHGVPFIDLCDMPYFNSHPELFKDAGHLNDDGAHIYTALFFEQLKPYLQKL